MPATTGYAVGVSANDVVLHYARETVWGQAPAVQFKSLRMTGEGFSSSKTRQRPQEINPTYQAAGAVTTKEEAKGQINMAFSFATYDDLLAALLGNDWQAFTLADDGIAAEAATSRFVGAAGDFTGIAVGQWIKVQGFAEAANNGLFRVTAKAGDGGAVTVQGALVDEAAGAAATIAGSMLRNGPMVQTFHFEKRLAAA
ncbi:MAG: hypothetical protein K2Q10_13715, partial [Rhodospirillales bacterium]|nr:hypothetical protein [Rhodospirillales bacterium]